MNNLSDEEDKRSGKDRRAMPPTATVICTQPCQPIVKSLDKIESELKSDQKDRDKEVHRKLDNIFSCLALKIPSKLFWRVIGGFFTLVFAIGGVTIAGTLWSIYGMVSEVKGDLKTISVTVARTASDVSTHIIRADNKNDNFDRRLDAIEQGKTFFNFYDKQHPPQQKENRK